MQSYKFALYAISLNMAKVNNYNKLFNRFQSHANRLVNDSNFLRKQILNPSKGKSYTNFKNRKDDVVMLQSKGLVNLNVIPLDFLGFYIWENLQELSFLNNTFCYLAQSFVLMSYYLQYYVDDSPQGFSIYICFFLGLHWVWVMDWRVI